MYNYNPNLNAELRNEKVFYPNDAVVLSDDNGAILSYHDGNYYFPDDTNYQNPISFTANDSQPILDSENSTGGINAYQLGDINNYAKPYTINLKFLDSDDKTNLTNGLPNPTNAIISKQVTAYTGDRIYYDSNSGTVMLTRYGVNANNVQPKYDTAPQSYTLIDFNKSNVQFSTDWSYSGDVQAQYATYNYNTDSSTSNGYHIADWTVGDDKDNTQMHPYGPDGSDNTAVVYMHFNQPYEQVNIPYIDVSTGKQIYFTSSKVPIGTPNNVLDQYLPTKTKTSQYGTTELIANDGYNLGEYSNYKYILNTGMSIAYSGENKIVTNYVFLLPFDPNDPANVDKSYPLTIHYVDQDGNQINGYNDIKLTGSEPSTIKNAMDKDGLSFIDYSKDGWQFNGIRFDSLQNDYTTQTQDQVFNIDSRNNGEMMFGKHVNIYIVLSKTTSSGTSSASSSASSQSSSTSSASSASSSASSQSSSTSSASSTTSNTSSQSSTTSSASSTTPSTSSQSSTTPSASSASSNASSQSSTTPSASSTTSSASSQSSTTPSASSTTSSASSQSSATPIASSTTSSASSQSSVASSESSAPSSASSQSSVASSASSQSSSNSSSTVNSSYGSSASSSSSINSSTSFSTSSSSHSNNSDRKLNKLPQTNESQSVSRIGLLGMLLVIIASVLSLLGLKKRNDKK
ncbi:hypothetical protein [Nicoliella lavandulae]|uniref:Gram-positive cocci surface proteins LPxTG domain-containing protein n=1 Tax=Nicoliella lavandulae TaxID=3082954 RepID=A0ABU8SK82_9LACO